VNIKTVTAILTVIGALVTAREGLVLSGQPITTATVVTALVPALLGAMGGLLTKRPGDVTKSKAEELAENRVTEALRMASMEPGPRNGD
jgi:drug/metabolite transporter (DMT)-like permease